MWIPMARLDAPTARVPRHTAGRPVSCPYASAMNAAPPSWRVATTRMPASSSASRTPRNDSPGTVNAMRTPAARRASAMNRPTVRGPVGATASDSRVVLRVGLRVVLGGRLGLAGPLRPPSARRSQALASASGAASASGPECLRPVLVGRGRRLRHGRSRRPPVRLGRGVRHGRRLVRSVASGSSITRPPQR